MTSSGMTSAPIASLTWRVALPISIGMFFNTMFNVVDMLCAGFLGTLELAALSISFPVFFILYATASGLSQGATALTANALGAGNVALGRRIFSQTLILAVVLGLALSALGLLSSRWAFRQLGAEGDYLRLVTSYMDVLMLGGIGFFLPVALNSALATQGKTKPYRNFLIAAFFGNLALNPLLMWGWGPFPAMGVSGIALATVIVHVLGAVYLWRITQRTGFSEKLSLEELQPDAEVMKSILKQSVPAILNMLTIAAGAYIVTWHVQHFGKEAVAALGIATRIEQLILMPAIGLSAALIAIVGQNHGANHTSRVREAWTTNVRYGVGLMVIGGALLIVSRHGLVGCFSENPIVREHGGNYLLLAGVTLCAYPILFATIFALQGMKRPAYGLWMGLGRQVIAPLLVFNLLAFTWGWGLQGIWWGIAFVTWSASAVAIWWGNRTIGVSPSPPLISHR